MALTRQKKAEKVTELAAELESSTSAIVGTFAKLTVAQDYNLRKVVREAGGKYRVLKNKLAGRASKGTKVEAALQGLKGVSSVAYTSGDPVALTKAISTWVTENAEFTFKLGIVDGKVISIEEIKQLATMPGRDELFSKLLFLINAPAQRLATVIAATGRDLAIVVNQAVEQNKFAGAAAAPEAKEEVKAEATSSSGGRGQGGSGRGDRSGCGAGSACSGRAFGDCRRCGARCDRRAPGRSGAARDGRGIAGRVGIDRSSG